MNKEQLDKRIEALEWALETIKVQEEMISLLQAKIALLSTPIIQYIPYPTYIIPPRITFF